MWTVKSMKARNVMNVEIRTRFDAKGPRDSDRKRKYGPELIYELLRIATQESVGSASRLTGVPYDTVKRYVTAMKRSVQSLNDAMSNMDNHPMMRKASQADRDRIIGARKRQLLLNTECAREAYRIAQRTGISLSRCIKSVAMQRGLNGDKVYRMIMEGRIPERWIDGSETK
jgi:hypothetical protein